MRIRMRPSQAAPQVIKIQAIFLFMLVSLSFLTSCKKDKVVYTTELNSAINSQSLALLGIYDVVNIHMNMVQGGDYAGCFNQDRDTIAGIVYDTNTVAAGGGCTMIHSTHTNGRFSGKYPVGASSSVGVDIELTFNNFYTNGVAFSGKLNYVWVSTDSIRVTSQNLIMTDQNGATTVSCDLTLVWNGGLSLSGSISGTGANVYSWVVTTPLNGGDQLSEIHTGRATFTAYDQELKQNFGNGEDDDFVTFEDVFEVRKIMTLPTL